MNVIVFGGTGFLGSHIAEQLNLSGYNVTVFDLKTAKNNQNLTYVQGDILDFESVKNAIKNYDIVYNFAGLSDLNDGVRKPIESIQLNILGNANILQACIERNIKRFVYASSIYVYSQKGGFYRCSKQASEVYIEEYSKVYGLNYTILRYGTLYGPRADTHNSIYRYLKQALIDKKIVCNNPDEMREYIYVRDAAKLSVEALDQKYINERLIVSGHYYMKVAEMLKVIKEILQDKVEIVYEPSVNQADHYTYTPYSFSPKIGQKLVSNTYTDIGQGLLECLEEIHNDKSFNI